MAKMTAVELEAAVDRSRRASGVPLRLEDPEIARQVAELLVPGAPVVRRSPKTDRRPPEGAPQTPRHRPHPAKAVIVGAGLTITEVAVAVGLNAHTLGRVLNRRVQPWPALRARLAEYLGRPEDELFL